MRVCTLSVWNVSVALSSSVMLTINRRRRRHVCTTKNIDETNVYRSALCGSGTRSLMIGHTHALHTAHLSISRPSTDQSKPSSIHLAMKPYLCRPERSSALACIHTRMATPIRGRTCSSLFVSCVSACMRSCVV